MVCSIDTPIKVAIISAIAIITAALIAGLFNIYIKDKGLKPIIGVILLIIIAGAAVSFVLYYPDEESKLYQLLDRAASSTPPSSPAVQVIITSPANKDKVPEVPEFITVKGTVVGDVKNAHLWVVIKAAQDLQYFPQGGEIHPTTNGEWSLSSVRIGAGLVGIGVPHELEVVQANEIMHEAFQLYFKIGLRCGKWIGFNHDSIITGTKKLATVTVVRR